MVFTSQTTPTALIPPSSRLSYNWAFIERWSMQGMKLLLQPTAIVPSWGQPGLAGSQKKQRLRTKDHHFHGLFINPICWWNLASPVLPYAPKAASHTTSCLKKYTWEFLSPLSTPPKSCRSELALGTDTLLVQKHEGKHPWGTKLW